MAEHPGYCPHCGSDDVAPTRRVGRQWFYCCAACLAKWVGKRKEKP